MTAYHCVVYLGLLASCAFLKAQDDQRIWSEVRRIAIDPGRQEFATDMTVVFTNQTQAVAAWRSYRNGRDSILARQIDLSSGKLGLVFELSEQSGAIANLSGGSLDLGQSPSLSGFTWSEWSPETGRWTVSSHRFPQQSFPGATQYEKSGSGIYTSYHHAGFARQVPGSQQTSEINVSLVKNPGPNNLHSTPVTGGLSFRPCLTKRGNTLWAIWDKYDENSGDQTVQGRQIHPSLEKVHTISPPDPGSRCITPDAIDSIHEGLCVAWVKLTDVIGGDGVVDMIHTAHVATIDKDDQWRLVEDANGSIEGAVFLNGLLPDLRPGKGYPSGYSGNRRKPMLLDGKDGVWLLWERKSKHGGSGTKTAGQLLGRQFRNGIWISEPLLIHEGLIDYRLPKPAKTIKQGDTFYVVGSKIPHHFKRPSYLVEVNLAKAKPIELDDWRDQFNRIKLPFENQPERYQVESGTGKTYQLYWGDLHCHSGLTGDAEGEPDEIVLYARDRAKLDVMVLQDNDEVHGRILTEGEYRLGETTSQWITEPGKFVALPGYEWTQRTSNKGVPEPFLSSFEQKIPGGYPNHRTVIYPMAGGPIIRYFEVGHHFDTFARKVAKAGGILHSQHPAFEISDHPIETNLEVTACWGIYIRNVPAKFHAELDKGRRMGFIGTSDSHRRNPGLCGGLTGIYAEELTPEAIMDALKQHRVFASNGSKIVLDSRVNGQLSDQIVKSADGNITVSLFLVGTTPILSARLIGTGGKTIARYKGNGTAKLKISKSLNELPEGQHWFYWAVEQQGNSTQYKGNISVARGNLAWSSPHFVEVNM